MDDKEARLFTDLWFASKCICKNMARPRSEDWLALQRVGRYLKRVTRTVQQFHCKGDDTNLQGYACSDWARDRQNMEVHKWSCDHVQWTLHEGLVEFATCTGFELGSSRIVRYDKSGSSAQWRGRCRHIKVRYLWIQSKIKDGDLLQKVLGTNNVANAMTKALGRRLMG